MTWLALILSMAAQEGPTPYTAASPTSHELYSGPLVRPYEPSWASTDAQGDAPMGTAARSIAAPTALRAYQGDYEASPTDGEVVYQQGMASAELMADSRMGPLDGLWRLAAADGSVLMELLMMDRGAGQIVEGAWRRPAQPEGAITSRRMGALTLIVRTGDVLTIEVDDPAAPARLTLQPEGPAWRGAMERDGESVAVVLSPAG